MSAIIDNRGNCCATCQHRRPCTINGNNYDKCDAPGVQRDPVTGMPKHPHCSTQRRLDLEGYCGATAGRFYEPAMRVGIPADLGCEVLP